MTAVLNAAQMRRYEKVGLKPTMDLVDLRFRWVARDAKDFDITKAITAVELERTIEGASTLTVTLLDPDGKLISETAKHVIPLKPTHGTERGSLRTAELDEGWERILAPDMIGRAMEVTLDGARFRLVKATGSYADSTVTLTFEDLIVYLLKRKRHPPRAVSRSKSTRAQFIRLLVSEVKLIRPVFVCPDLNVVQRIDSGDSVSADGSESVKTQAGNSNARGSVLNRRYPAHSAGQSATRMTPEQVRQAAAEGGFRGRELTGMEQIAHGESDYYPGVISHDGGIGLWQCTPRVWGSRELQKLADLGGEAELRNPVVNATMARFLYVNAGEKFTPWYGTKYLTVSPGPGAAGSGDYAVSGESGATASTGGSEAPKARSYQFERKKGENSWTAIQRLATEVNRRAFVVGEAFLYMSEDMLYAQRPRYEITPATQGLMDLTYDVDWGKVLSEVTITVTLDRWGAPPGSVILLDGFGPPDGRWLVSTIRRDWFSPVAEITLAQPGRQLAEPAHETTSGSGADVDAAGGSGGKVDQLIAICGKFSGSYVYGGGHGPALTSLTYSQGLDCSSSTSLALFKAGMWDSRSTARTSGEFANWGQPGEGEQVTVHYSGAHVFLAFKGGGSVKRFDTAGGNGPRTHASDRGPYGSTRHWPGT